MPPSPTAAAQRFTEPERTSPAAKIPGQLRLQRPRRTAHAFPCGRVDDRVAGFDKALFIRSTMMTSNRPIEEWGKLLSDVSAAGAILDRLLHHAEIFKTSLEMSAFS
jgi:IstB-like ATP binding protein